MRDSVGIGWAIIKYVVSFTLAACWLLSSWSAAQNAAPSTLPDTCDFSMAAEAEQKNEMPQFVGCLIDDVGESFTRIVIGANLVPEDSDKRVGEITRQSFAPGTSLARMAASGRKLSLFYSKGSPERPERARVAIEAATPVVEGETLRFIIRKYPSNADNDVIGFDVLPDALIRRIDPPSPIAFSNGETEREIEIETRYDPAINGPQVVTMRLRIVDANAIIMDGGGTATGVVNDRIEPSSYSITLLEDRVFEGEQLQFRVARTGAVTSASVLRYIVTRDDGGNPIERSLTFPPGETELSINDVTPAEVGTNTRITVALFPGEGETQTPLDIASGMIEVRAELPLPPEPWYDPFRLGWPLWLLLILGILAIVGGAIWCVRRWFRNPEPDDDVAPDGPIPPPVPPSLIPVVQARIAGPGPIMAPQPGGSFTLPDVNVQTAIRPGTIAGPMEFPFTILEGGDDPADHN